MTERIKVPVFVLSNGLSFSGGYVSRNIEHLGTAKPAYELSASSIMHADQAALYFAGFCEKYGIETGIPEEAKKAAIAHYEAVHNNRGSGNWNNDGVDTDIDFKPLPGAKLPEGYEYVLWMKKPEWKQENGIWIPTEGEEKPFVTEWPPDGYGPLPTMYGFRDPRTGWALATTPDRNKAVREMAREFEKYMDRDNTQELAEKEVSYSVRREHGSGKGALFRGFLLGDGGPFFEAATVAAATGAGGWVLFPSVVRKRKNKYFF